MLDGENETKMRKGRKKSRISLSESLKIRMRDVK